MAAWLVGLTEDACAALEGERRMIDRFPFRVGRESRGESSEAATTEERRFGKAPEVNDLYLVEVSGMLDVSREHFQIEREAEQYFLTDRATACGTLVEGRKVGGARKRERVPLHDHDVIIVGTSASRFVFKFRID